MTSGAPVGVVLAGGRSSRMGTDKALLLVEGRPMAVRVADALRVGGCVDVRCQGGDADRLRAVGLAVLPDPEPHAGVLAAIVSALAAIAPAAAVVAACDLAYLDGPTVERVVHAGHERSGAAVAVACDDHGAHLLAWWSPIAIGALRQLVIDGEVSYRRAIDRLDAVRVPVEPAVVRNVNRPADLAGDRPS
jgi:molybdopterin-guanine dinucleotide biosynthesis protein A